MKITRVSPLTGKENTLDINITLEDYLSWSSSKIPVQKAFPKLSANEREFLITGLAPGEWEEFLGPER